MSRKRKQSKNRTGEVEDPQKPLTNWIYLAFEDQPKLAIPIGHRFQADLPLYNGPSGCDHNCPIIRECNNNNNNKNNNNKGKRARNGNKTRGIGEGRAELCSCPSPGGPKCVEYHLNEERMTLKTELGDAYERWKFHEMGSLVSESWTKKDQQTFDSIVKENRISQGDGFMNRSLSSLPFKNRASIVSYYLNVYVPRRISRQTRSGCREIDTDDDDDEDEESERKKVNAKNPRVKAPVTTEVKSRKSSYLSGCR